MTSPAAYFTIPALFAMRLLLPVAFLKISELQLRILEGKG